MPVHASTPTLLLSIPLVIVAGCASGATESTPPAVDAGADGDGTHNGTNDAGNNGAADVGQDGPDTGPDVTVEDVDDGCGECCPGARLCLDATSVGVCEPDGQAYARTSCGGDMVCVAATGQCAPPPVSCQPGVSTCIDIANQQTCNARGDGFTTRSCGEGQCVRGNCVTGASTSEACEADGDCAGGECLCRGTETCTGGFQTVWGPTGYCTTASCGVGGCGANEVCVDFGVPGVLTGGMHCLKDCLRCSEAGYSCQKLPVQTGGMRQWQDACSPDALRGFGQFCTEGSQCRGGTCLTGGDWPANGYCAAPCSETALCPSDTKCVQFIDGQYYCAAHCGDGRSGTGDCPEGLGIDVSCQVKADLHGAGVVSVCMPR